MRKELIIVSVTAVIAILLLVIVNIGLSRLYVLDPIGVENVVVQFIVAIAAFLAIFATFQINKQQIQENRRISIEERQQQQRPVLAPVGEIVEGPVKSKTFDLYQANGVLNWEFPGPLQVKVRNVGGGAALNVHCILHGSDPRYNLKFVFWDGGPLGTDSDEILLQHPQQLKLDANDSLDSLHPLYDSKPPLQYHKSTIYIARLTISYTDLFGKKHMSMYDYTLQHHWVHVITKEVAFDLKEANEQKKVQNYSAPSIQTSP